MLNNTVKIDNKRHKYSGLKPFEEGFHSWFNNNMAVVMMSIEHPRMKKAESKMRFLFFLDAIRHHFMFPQIDKKVENAFRYLTVFFQIYPWVKARQAERAIKMLERVYEAIGIKFPEQLKSRKFKEVERVEPRITYRAV